MAKVYGVKLAWVAALVVVAAGCRDSGLPDRNLPLEEAEQRALLYPVYEPAAATALQYDGSDWVVAGRPLQIPASLLVPVSAEGGEAWALATDAPPRDRLYVRAADGWTPLARALGAGEAAAH